jgi:hypothetical protein
MTVVAPRHAFESPGIDGNDPHRVQFGVPQKVAHPRIAPVRSNENLQNGLRLVAQLGDYGMKTVDESGWGHAWLNYRIQNKKPRLYGVPQP